MEKLCDNYMYADDVMEKPWCGNCLYEYNNDGKGPCDWCEEYNEWISKPKPGQCIPVSNIKDYISNDHPGVAFPTSKGGTVADESADSIGYSQALNTASISALDEQIGGDHYKKMTMQPLLFCEKNNLNACETLAIKYICRHRDKDGLEDVKKAIHCLKALAEMVYNEYIE